MSAMQRKKVKETTNRFHEGSQSRTTSTEGFGRELCEDSSESEGVVKGKKRLTHSTQLPTFPPFFFASQSSHSFGTFPPSLVLISHIAIRAAREVRRASEWERNSQASEVDEEEGREERARRKQDGWEGRRGSMEKSAGGEERVERKDEPRARRLALPSIPSRSSAPRRLRQCFLALRPGNVDRTL
jgi:hypothetical protein